MMMSRLRLAKPERVVFERPPIVLTVFQVRFSNISEVTDPGYIEPFKNAIQNRYRVFAPSKQIGMQFDFISGEPRRLETVQWRFTDEDENWTVVLAPDFLTLETRRYEHFEDFLSQLRFVLGVLTEHIRPKVGTRIGLRYINEIRLGTERLASVIRPELLGPLSVAGLEEHVAQSNQEVLLRLSEDRSIQVRHGLFPDGGAVQPRTGEQPPSGPFYLLDFDASRIFSAPTLLRIEADIIQEYVKEYHDDLETLFRWSITEEFTESLGVRDRAN